MFLHCNSSSDMKKNWKWFMPASISKFNGIDISANRMWQIPFKYCKIVDERTYEGLLPEIGVSYNQY